MKSLKVQVLAGFIVLVVITAALVYWKRGGAGARDLKKDFSYTLGSQYAANIKKQNVEVDSSSFMAGISDVLEGRKLRLSEEEMQTVLREWQVQFDSQMLDKAKENRAAGEAFLQQFRSQAGVKTTSSGLNYKVVQDGKGASPKAGDLVRVIYTGKLSDGTVFDASPGGQAIEMPLRNLVPAWLEALPLMKAGSKWEIAFPAKLGYGDSIHPKIPPGSALVFEIELVSFAPPKADAK